ncbi:anaerobic sulfite reductase subunit B [Anaerolineae bacterium]|nr:anaerobic sulfite reductase subunit B [Anaerolineae bacterium]
MESPYLPIPGTVERSIRVSEKERLFTISPSSDALLKYRPGQFYMVGLPGYGEAPISITSGPGEKKIELCIRAVGNLTNAFHNLRKGDNIWLRGPFGRGFALEELEGRDMVFVAGGIGIVPMRSLLKAVLASRGKFGRLTLIYGSKGPEEILFAEEMDEWRRGGMDVFLTVDKPSAGWKGNTGVVTTLIPRVETAEKNTIGVIIGPPVMYRFVILSLNAKGLGAEDIFVSLERRMKCGVGKCGHCQINSIYVCQCGPVFRMSELKGMPEAI